MNKNKMNQNVLRIPTDGDLKKKHHLMFSFARKLAMILG